MKRKIEGAGDRRSRRACGRLAPLAVALGLVLAGEAAATEDGVQRAVARALDDPRLLAAHRLDRLDQEALAAEYGLESFLPPPAAAALAVGNCNDTGPGSLRETIAQAADGEVIDLRGLACSTITLTSGQIAVPRNVSILGPGPSALTLRAGQAKYDNRIFNHTGGGSFIVQGVRLADGISAGSANAPSASGGCIASNGTLTLGNALFVGVPSLGVVLDHCRAIAFDDGQGRGLAAGGGAYAPRLALINSTITGCEASAHGTGLRIDGGGGAFGRYSLVMLASTLRGNRESGTKYGGGGAAATAATTPHQIVASTIEGNSAGQGGGLAFGYAAKIRSSTISGNRAAGGAGVIAFGISQPNVLVSNSTITANVASSDSGGAGFYINNGASLDLQSTIVAGNFRATSVPDDLGGGGTLTGANAFIGVAPVALPLPPGSVTGDPRLAPLAANGGRTRTHALRPDSRAIGFGNNAAGEPFDQRGAGFARVVGAHPDIGAYEFDPDRIFVDGFD
ncbi:choice-of-anchor Q domain-containing protein [Dokdonella ginsengisoli]|uniref:Choice-of-anchor Q domain-containing protein n=1 Tax=Dokdonella ginsengisoli TaxID=363846 RepID=A0ABV9QZE1_9GAMM